MKNRKYGLMKTKASCEEFINKLYEAMQAVNAKPFKCLSGYTYLNALGDEAEKKTMDSLYKGGIIQEVMSKPEDGSPSQNMVLYNRTLYASETVGIKGDNSAAAALSDDLYIIATPPLEEGTYDDGWSDYLPRIEIVAFYNEQQTPEPTEQDPEPQPVTVRRRLSLQLGSNNSGLRPGYDITGLAYEITPTSSGDTLVKLAWCLPDIAGTEDNLKNAMAAINIFNYKATEDDGAITITNSYNSHSDEVFGMSSPCGGFVIHRMKYGTLAYGITIFNGKDRTPLYTWCDGAGPWDKAEFVNRSIDGAAFGRIITDEKIGDGPNEYRLKMAALAPIMCASSSNYASTAKWMPQGWHDYSYYDKSGHIYLKTNVSKLVEQASNTPVFFADHGLYLHDGALGDYNLTDRGLPDANPENLITINRPDLPDLMPNADRFYAYFDSRDGISESGWANYFDSEYDMRFVGSPTINADGSVRFVNRASGPAVGWCKALYGATVSGGFRTGSSLMIMVAKFNLPRWSSKPSPLYMPFIAGYIPGDDIKSELEGAGVAHIGINHEPSASSDYLATWGYISSSEEDSEFASISNDSPYIVIMSITDNGNNFFMWVYSINSDGSYTLINNGNLYKHRTSLQIYLDAKNGNIPMRFYLGGYPVNDASWRSTPLQVGKTSGGGKGWSEQDIPADYSSHYPTIDCKFLALSDAYCVNWQANGAWNQSAVLSYLANTFKEEE